MALSRYAAALLLVPFGLLIISLSLDSAFRYGRLRVDLSGCAALASGAMLIYFAVRNAWRTVLWVSLGREFEFAGIRGARRVPWTAVTEIQFGTEWTFLGLASHQMAVFRVDGYGACAIGFPEETRFLVDKQLMAMRLSRLVRIG